MFLQRISLWHFQCGPELVGRSGRGHIRAARHHVAGKRVLLKHVIKGRIQLILIHLPSHQRTLGQIGRQQSLTNSPNHARFQHRPYPLQHYGLAQPRAFDHHAKRITLKTLQLILTDREYLRVDLICNLNGYGGGIHGAVLSQQKRTLANCFLFIAETPRRLHRQTEAPVASGETRSPPALRALD